MSEADAVPVTLKWSKHTYISRLSIRPGSSSKSFKEDVRALTGVPVERQKLLCRGVWKGPLRDEVPIDDTALLAAATATAVGRRRKPLTVTLVGSADAPPDAPRERTKFVEDLTPEDVAAAAAEEEARALEASEGMIAAIQRHPLRRGDDEGKAEMYQYNRLVTGLPQRQIEDILRERRKEGGALRGEVVMTVGLELRRAYVNALTVLPGDGTLVSGLDDGHVQLWRNGEMFEDLVHEGGEGGVEALVSFPHSPESPAFATAGRGCVRLWLWTDGWDCVRALPSPPGMTPASLAAMEVGGDAEGGDRLALAAAFRVVRRADPNAFRLVPQDEEGRRRRAQAEAEEAAMWEALGRASRRVHVWVGLASAVGPQLAVLEPGDPTGSHPVSALAGFSSMDKHGTCLVCGDEVGGLRLWRFHQAASIGGMQWEQSGLLQLRPPATDAGVISVACMEPLTERTLAVSTDIVAQPQQAGSFESGQLPGATALDVPTASAVFIVDVTRPAINVVLDAHKDVVRCMCSLPDGGLATGGGKLDATVRIWEQPQVCAGSRGGEKSASGEEMVTPQISSESTVLEKIGYVFALTSLPDAKPGSRLFALAGARYNVVKVCL